VEVGSKAKVLVGNNDVFEEVEVDGRDGDEGLLVQLARRRQRNSKYKKDFPFFVLIISAFLHLLVLPFITVRWNSPVEKQLVTKISSLRAYKPVLPLL
jgi:hypothetical protein